MGLFFIVVVPTGTRRLAVCRVVACALSLEFTVRYTCPAVCRRNGCFLACTDTGEQLVIHVFVKRFGRSLTKCIPNIVRELQNFGALGLKAFQCSAVFGVGLGQGPMVCCHRSSFDDRLLGRCQCFPNFTVHRSCQSRARLVHTASVVVITDFLQTKTFISEWTNPLSAVDCA